jgi:AraC-like DNA-binding protein
MTGAAYQPFPMLERSSGQVWSYAPEYRRPRHFHSEPELNLVVAGSATFGIGNEVSVLGAGELLAFTPGQDHVLLTGSRDLVLFAVGLRRGLAQDVLGDAGEAALSPLHARLAPRDAEALVARCADATGRAGADQAVAELWLAAQWSSKRGEATRAPAHVLTRRALSALDSSPELDRTALARGARANPSEIGRYFRRDLGVSLVEYRARLRLLRFIEHADRGASLTAAALDAGFGSYSQCHRVFQQTLGLSPRRFFEPHQRRLVEDEFTPQLQPR